MIEIDQLLPRCLGFGNFIAAHHLCKVMLKMTATFYLKRSDPFFDTNPDTMMTQI
jgi:hypothetical protein